MEIAELEKQGLCGLIFDCDGVMIDSELANRKFYNLALNALGLPPMTKEQEEYAFRATARQALENVTPEHLRYRIDDVLTGEVNYECEVLPHIKLMPGFREFVKFAREKGFLLAIDTNRTERGIMCVLDFFSLGPYFDPVISSSNAIPKPSPDGIENICEAWGVGPKSVLFVGDSISDRETAWGAGALFAAFGGKGLEGDIGVPNFAVLEELLKNVPALHC